MKRQSTRVLFFQALTLLLFMAPLLVLGGYIWNKHQIAQTRLSALEPRHARLQGLNARQAELEAATKQNQTILAQHAYPAGQDSAKAGNDAQQRIRTVFTAGELAINSLQVLEPKDTEQFQRIGIAMQVEGPLPAMQDAMLKLKNQTPTILVESLHLQSISPVRPASTQRLLGSFKFTVLRNRS